jgi:hypothetical protein
MKRPHSNLREAGDLDYQAAVDALGSGDSAVMERLASDWRSAPEVLFFLSQAPTGATRALVAGNPSTPEIVEDFLINDEVAEVRARLGRKIAAKLPELSGPEAARLRDAATAKLLVLARDAEVEVRRALSSAVAGLDCIPREIVMTLVRDVDALVSVPIIEFSPLLDDDDLIALIAEPPNALSLSAMARRSQLSPQIVDSLIDARDVSVLVTLLHNTATQIRESALDRITEMAAAVEDLRAPLVQRPELTERLVVKLSNFVASSLIFELSVRSGLSDEVRHMLERRLAEGADEKPGEIPSEEQIASASRRHAEREVIAGIARRAGLSLDAVQRVFSTGMPKAIVALAWKAELSMATALALQAFPGRIVQSRRIAEKNGRGFPMSPRELEWHLFTLGIDDSGRARANEA